MVTFICDNQSSVIPRNEDDIFHWLVMCPEVKTVSVACRPSLQGFVAGPLVEACVCGLSVRMSVRLQHPQDFPGGRPQPSGRITITYLYVYMY